MLPEMLLQGSILATLSPIVSAIVGAFLALVLQYSLPDDVKTKIRYWVNRIAIRLSFRDHTVNSKLTRGYELENSVELEVFREELRDAFNTTPERSEDRFHLQEVRDNVTYDVDIRLDWESNGGSMMGAAGGEFGMEMQEQREVQHIRISVETDLPYHQLENLLFRAYAVIRDVESEIPSEVSGTSYSIACELGSPPYINEYMARLGFEDVIATTPDGLEFETRGDLIRVRNLGDSEVDQAITKIHKMVTLFG